MIREFVREVLKEDLGRGDLFRDLAVDKEFKAKVIAKASGVFSGEKYIKVMAEELKVDIKLLKVDRELFEKGDILVELRGRAKDILSLERSFLNTLQHSSGIATNVNNYLKALDGVMIKLLDTRKTRPLLREFEKYSTKNGGAINHRMGLDDSLMIKDTHLKTISNLKEFVKIARLNIPFTSKIELECENFKEVKAGFEAGVDIIMCDNFQAKDLVEVVEYRNSYYPHILLEASGNITMESIKEYAETGIDAISSGSLIHQATWIDLSMKID